MMPNKFNKKLWVKRGGFTLIDEAVASSSTTATTPGAGAPDSQTQCAASADGELSSSTAGGEGAQEGSTLAAAAPSSSGGAAAGGNKITGTIIAVLYDAQIKQLRKMPGAWWVHLQAMWCVGVGGRARMELHAHASIWPEGDGLLQELSWLGLCFCSCGKGRAEEGGEGEV